MAKDGGSEHADQCALFSWAAYQEGRYPELRLMFAVPNGGYRNKVTAIKLKQEGVRPGVPDVCLPVPRGKHHGLFLELKHGRNTTSEKQDWWLEELEKQGYCAAVAWGDEEAREIITDYLEGKL